MMKTKSLSSYLLGLYLIITGGLLASGCGTNRLKPCNADYGEGLNSVWEQKMAKPEMRL